MQRTSYLSAEALFFVQGKPILTLLNYSSRMISFYWKFLFAIYNKV